MNHISACYRLLFLQDTSEIKARVRIGITHSTPYMMFSSVRLVQDLSKRAFSTILWVHALLYTSHTQEILSKIVDPEIQLTT